MSEKQPATIGNGPKLTKKEQELFAAVIAVIVYGAAAPADMSADAVRARERVILVDDIEGDGLARWLGRRRLGLLFSALVRPRRGGVPAGYISARPTTI